MSQGMGLQNIKNRVQLLEGSFKMQSGKEGTEARIVLPV